MTSTEVNVDQMLTASKLDSKDAFAHLIDTIYNAVGLSPAAYDIIDQIRKMKLIDLRRDRIWLNTIGFEVRIPDKDDC